MPNLLTVLKSHLARETLLVLEIRWSLLPRQKWNKDDIINPNKNSLSEHFRLEKEDILHPFNFKTIIKF